jgi:hypothetical protein
MRISCRSSLVGAPILACLPPRSVDELLAAPLPRRVVDAVALMRALLAALPRDDGVASFTRLYLEVTEAVEEAARPGRYRDARFVRWLDVVFANLFFGALRNASRRPSGVPRAWAALIEAREKREITPIQFALAGMNAHINRDLPLALVETWEALALEPPGLAAQYEDFARITLLLAETEERVKPWLVTGVVADVDRSLGRVDDVLALWNVHKAREAAWINAETLWALRAAPDLRSRFLLALDRMVGFAGRGILRPLV